MRRNYGITIPDSYLQRVLNAIEILPTEPPENIEKNKRKLEGVLFEIDYEPHPNLKIRLDEKSVTKIDILFDESLEKNTGFLMPFSDGTYVIRIPFKETETQRKLTYFHELIELYLMHFYCNKLNSDERHNLSVNYENIYQDDLLFSERQLEFDFHKKSKH